MIKKSLVYGIIGVFGTFISTIMIIYVLNTTINFSKNINIQIAFLSIIFTVSIIFSIFAIIFGKEERKNKKSINYNISIVGLVFGFIGVSFISVPFVMSIFIFIPYIFLMMYEINSPKFIFSLFIFSFAVTIILHIYFIKKILKVM